LGLGLGFITTDCTGYAKTQVTGAWGNRWQTRRLNSLNSRLNTLNSLYRVQTAAEM